MKATHYNLNSKIKTQNAKLRKSVHRSLFTVHYLRGFTLLEVMIALAIVGATVIAILHTVNFHADVAYDDTLTTKMLLLAREKIVDMEINPKNDKGIIPETEFSFETIVKDLKDEEENKDKGIVELKAIVRGYDKEIVLRELVIKKTNLNLE